MLRRAVRVVLLFVLVLQSVVAFGADVQKEVVPLERNGIQLHLARYQTDDGGEKTPLLMVHGLTYSSHEFDVNYGDYSLVRFFADNGYSVWLLDIAGYGSSQKVEDGCMPNSDYAAEDIAAAAKLITATSKTEKLTVLGWSWGTVTSGRFAAKYSDLVDKLVLYAPIVAGLVAMEVTDAYQATSWEHAAGDFQVKADGSIDYDVVEPTVADTFLSNCWRYDGAGSPNGGRRDLLVAPTERLIPTADIKAPTLLIVGDKDPYVSTALCEEALKTLANGELKVLEGAAHAMMMEKPYYKEFRESVLEFLKKDSNGRGKSGGGCNVGWSVLLFSFALMSVIEARGKKR
ncbi:MAG: alpha/beta hydrolase [Synergistaceae bacterium]|jgi:pimeloyl-ACP methyl ester carboxylesterase|nr:alpha/beta hydrolase [Synergistaceae bacterium]